MMEDINTNKAHGIHIPRNQREEIEELMPESLDNSDQYDQEMFDLGE